MFSNALKLSSEIKVRLAWKAVKIIGFILLPFGVKVTGEREKEKSSKYGVRRIILQDKVEGSEVLAR